jgi:hypothetical protein
LVNRSARPAQLSLQHPVLFAQDIDDVSLLALEPSEGVKCLQVAQ